MQEYTWANTLTRRGEVQQLLERPLEALAVDKFGRRGRTHKAGGPEEKS